MKRIISIFVSLLVIISCSSFTVDEIISDINKDEFNIDTISTNEKQFDSEDFDMCGDGSVKTYMEYSLITSPRSKQFVYINENMNVDQETGFLYDKDGFIGAALGKHFGEIGSKYYFTLENGVVLPIVKIESKAEVDTDESNCFNPIDKSIIEFVVDTQIAHNYFGDFGNGLVLSGNYGNYLAFKGNIVKAEKVNDISIKKEITYKPSSTSKENINIFYYGSGY